MEKPRLARLASIMTSLQSKRMVTAPELAERHGVSVRTIYRDIRTLEQSGVPIYTEEGKGYALVEGYRLPPVMFTQEEAQALITANAIVQSTKDSSLKKHLAAATQKIKAVLRQTEKDKAEKLEQRIHFRPFPSLGSRSEYLSRIQMAVVEERVLRIEYLSVKGEPSSRDIEPLALYATRGNWIVIAYCRKREANRAFRLDGIIKCFEEGSNFPSRDFTLEEYFKSHSNWPTTPDTPLTQGPANLPKKTAMKAVKMSRSTVVGLKITTKMSDQSSTGDIANLWKRFMEEDIMNQIPNRKDQRIWSVYFNYQGDHEAPYDVLVGCEVNELTNLPNALSSVEVQEGDYAQFTNKGALSQGVIQQAWGEVWNSNLPRTWKTDVEIYDERAMNPEDMEFDIFVGVENS